MKHKHLGQYVKGLEEHFRMRRQHPKTYTGRRATPINDCWKAPAGTPKADLAEDHREEMKARRKRSNNRITRLEQQVEHLRKRGTLQFALMNFARTKRQGAKSIRNSIWPEGKVAKPGRMG